MRRQPAFSLATSAMALVAWLAGGNAPSAAAVFEVVGFGDSVTHAVTFDVGGGSTCNAGNPDTCGYIGRLGRSAYYDCDPSTCRFANRGRPSETTIAGLTRLNQVLSERPWDLVLLMEGTNDLNTGISVQTAQFNLSQMAARAKARNVGTAQASIIWFNPSVSKPNLGGLNGAARSLRNAIASQANASRRCFVDAWSRLCPAGSGQIGCFNRNYWKGGADGVGHPNASGYSILTDEFYSVLGSPGLPGAAEIVAPLEQACAKDTEIRWIKESVAGTSCGNWFRVQLEGPGGTTFDDWRQEADVCTGSDCTLILPGGLSKGEYSVRVQTRNTSGYGPWTRSESFSTVPSAPKKVAKTFGPTGQFFINGGLLAELEWKPVSNTDGYRIEIASTRDGVILDEVVTGENECSGKRCVYVTAQPLPTGDYTWRVRAENICGGTFTEPTAFEVIDGPPATAPLAASPGGERIFDPTPTFKWEPVIAAFDFEIEDALGVSTIVSAADACSDGVCRFTSSTLGPGFYTWRVRGLNPLGQSPWSQPVSFQIADCDCVEGRAAGGSSFLLATPREWNGDLVVWSHRSNPFGIKEVENFGRLAQRQFDQGYALATTSYSVTGWPLFKSKRDLEKVYSTFAARFGEPANVYIAGESTGALVALAAVETADLGNLVGALAMCGPLAGAPNWEGTLDLRLAYDALCSEAPRAVIPGGPKGLPGPTDLTEADIAAAVNICTGVDERRPDRTVEQKQRLRQLVELAGITNEGLQEAMRHATFDLADLVRDRKKLKGLLPVGNVGVDYGTPVLNTTIQRASPDPGARAKLERFQQLTGEVGETRVISLHTTLDPVYYVENQTEYSALAPAENLTLGIVQESTASHCGFEEAEELAAWRALAIWAEGGAKPKPKNLQSRCNGLKSTLGGSCRFEARPKLDPLDSRILARP